MIDRDLLVDCQFEELTTLFPGRSLDELRRLRHMAQSARSRQRTRERKDGKPPQPHYSERKWREDAQIGSERLRIAILQAKIKELSE